MFFQQILRYIFSLENSCNPPIWNTIGFVWISSNVGQDLQVKALTSDPTISEAALKVIVSAKLAALAVLDAQIEDLD